MGSDVEIINQEEFINLLHQQDFTRTSVSSFCKEHGFWSHTV